MRARTALAVCLVAAGDLCAALSGCARRRRHAASPAWPAWLLDGALTNQRARGIGPLPRTLWVVQDAATTHC
jgi:hypothetical protein